MRVHRLVQAVTRDPLNGGQKRALNLVVAVWPPGPPEDYRSWPVYARLAPYIEVVTEHADRYPALTEKRIDVLRKLGIYLTASGQFRAARTIFKRALDIAEAAYGPGKREVAIALGNLGQVQVLLGDLEEARSNIERALAAFQEAYGLNHVEVARVFGNLAVLQQRLGELREARASIERALAIFQTVRGPNDPEVARTFVNLGIIQRDLGELRQALTSNERATAIYEAVHGPAHRDLGPALMALGIVQLRLWKLRKANASFKRAVSIIWEADKLVGRTPADSMKDITDWRFVKQHKIFSLLLFGFVLLATIRTIWRQLMHKGHFKAER
jgi:tetratricopeptide (TPR) repeat protein